MKKAYEKLIEDNKLTIDELPADAKTGIKALKSVEQVMELQKKKAEKAGKEYKPNKDITDRIKAYDKWVAGEIIDYLDDKNSNPSKPPEDVKEIIDDIKDDGKQSNGDGTQTPPATNYHAKGADIDKELASMFKSGKAECTLEELKGLAPTAYDLIFDTYEKDGENGIKTSHFLLVEKNNIFVLTKK